MPKYPVLEPLNHDQQDYAPGDLVEMSEELAARLLPVGVLGEAGADEESAAPPEGKLSAAEAIAKAAAATAAELDALAAGETRVTVVAAIDARRMELGQQQG